MKLLRSFLCLTALAAGFPAHAAPTNPISNPILQGNILLSNGVSTIAALRSATFPTTIQTGYEVLVGGYYQAGDGNGGTFVYNAASTSTDDGGIVIQNSGLPGRFIREYSGPLSVKWFGAHGDGATDDTAIIQRAIDDSAYGLNGVPLGAEVDVPSSTGSYVITNTLFLGYPQPAGVFGFVTTQLVGKSQTLGAASISGSPSITTHFAALDRPAIAIESGRGSAVMNLVIQGQNTDSYFAQNFYSPTALRDYFWDATTWGDAAINAQSSSKRRYSPYAGIVSNAYSGAIGETSPTPYPAVSIPSYLQGLFGVSSIQYGAYPSAGSRLQNVGAQNFDVGILFNAFSGANGDHNITDKLNVFECVYGVSAGQVNMRAFTVTNSLVEGCYVAVADNVHGTQRARLNELFNCQLGYNAFWISSQSDPVALVNCYGESGGVIGTCTGSVNIRNCLQQVCTFNNYQWPLVTTTRLTVDGLFIFGSVSDDVNNYMTGNFPIPYVIQADFADLKDIFVYDNGTNMSTYTVSSSFVPDIAAFNGSTVINEGQVIYGMTRWMHPGIVSVPYRQGQCDTRYMGTFLLNNSANHTVDSLLFNIASSSSATLAQRFTVPYYCPTATSLSNYENVRRDITLTGSEIDFNWTSFTQSQTTNTYTTGGSTYTTRNIYLDVLYNPNPLNRVLVKGWTYAGALNGFPVVMVCTENPTDTGITHDWRFKLIYGFDGRTSHASGFTLPGSGTVLSSGFIDYRPTRIVNQYGPIWATFTSGSKTVAIDTSYGIDATKTFAVGDVIVIRDGSPGILAYTTFGQKVYPQGQVTAVGSSSSITIANNAGASGTFEIYTN